MPRFLVSLLLLSFAIPGRAEDGKTVEQLAEQVRKSVVVVTTPGRDNKRGGLGTGFVVGEGLIATNLHVIGEGRAIGIETADGKKYEATAVHAFDRAMDLAIIRVETKGLPTLSLADTDKLKDGQSLVAVGNPQGLKHSVVSGVLSGKREIDGRPMLQLAMPVEQGNSGGPVVDKEGHVVGVITMKSAVTENLGFAVSINRLKPLLTKPNSVPMTAWKTIGNLDPDYWRPMLGADWRQRAGRILVEEPGTGFGGRSYCLNLQPTPKLPFEVAVTLKLDDESGAAGLIFHHGDDGRHYGFYPSGRGFRLTRFDGSDVYSWKILEEATSEAYKQGDWNTIKVRLEKGKILCYVNDKLLIESTDTELTEGKVGLAKFRNTKAEFKFFRVASKIASSAVTADLMTRIQKEMANLNGIGVPTPELLGKLSKDGAPGREAIRQQAKLLEERAKNMRRLAEVVHHQSVLDEMKKVLSAKSPDLIHAALLIAKLDNEELDIDSYRHDVEHMAKKIASKLPKDADEKAKVKALSEYLFNERGFHGSRGDYYNRSNSYLNEVLDDREGLPIALSVIYMELGRQLGLNIEGVGLPGHFVVRHVPKKGEKQLIDVFEGGKFMSRADAEKKVKDVTGEALEDSALATVSPKAIVVRMVNNLLRLAQDDRDLDGSRKYLDFIIGLDPDHSVRERGMRAVLRAQQGDRAGSLADIDWILEKMPEDIDLDAIRAFRRRVERSR